MDEKLERRRLMCREYQKRYRETHPEADKQDDRRRAWVRAAVQRWRDRRKEAKNKTGEDTA